MVVGVTLDLGTGDGRAALRAARADPRRFVVAIDADASSMVEASRRAAHPHTCVPNLCFVVAAVEALPDDLDGVADQVLVHFPWGSLLRGVAQGRPEILSNIARVTRPGGELLAMWSITGRDVDAAGAPAPLDVLGAAYAAAGFEVVELRGASLEEIAAIGSTWAKRLGAGARRPVTLVRAFRRWVLPRKALWLQAGGS